MIVQSNPGHAMTNRETAPQKEAKLIGVLPMPFVSDVAKSIKFYQQLGFVRRTDARGRRRAGMGSAADRRRPGRN